MDRIQARFRLERGGFSLDVDLDLPGRGVTALFGASGSGKTTLLRCIAGLERAPQGRLCVGGERWQDEGHWVPVHKRPLGYVFQEASLFPHLSVLANLRYGQRRSRSSSSVDLDGAIELLGIRPLLERRPGSLSGGERQRVGMARALAVGPRLLLMDEPLAALDQRRKGEVLPYLERLHRELAIPVLYVTHAMAELARLADHVVVLEAGRARDRGALGEVLTRLGGPLQDAEDAAAVFEGVVGALDPPWHLARVDFEGGSLWVREAGQRVGQRARVRVLARDVSLALEPGQGSIQNLLRGTVEALGDDAHPALCLVRMRVGPVPILARITRRAAEGLGVVVGREFWVQVKSVALLA